jgi:hypothetical protein
MSEPLSRLPDEDEALRTGLRRAAAAVITNDGDWANVARRVRRRRAGHVVVRVGVPTVCVLVLAGALWARSRASDDHLIVRTTTGTSSIPTVGTSNATTTMPRSPETISPSIAPATTATTPDVSSTEPPSSVSTSAAINEIDVTSVADTRDTSPENAAPPIITAPAAPAADPGRAVGLDLGLTGGDINLIAVTDGTVASRAIAAMPAAVRPSLPVWAGDRIFAHNATAFATYDPRADRWSEPSALPEPRYQSPASRVTVSTGAKVIIWGGSTTEGSFTVSLDALVWDVATGSWSHSANAPSARSGEVSGASLGDLVVFNGDGANLAETAPFLVYHVSTNTWTELASPVPLTYTPRVAAYGGKLLAIGKDHSASVLWDPATDAWTTFAPSTPRDFGRHPTFTVTDGSRLVYLTSNRQLSVFDGVGWFESQSLTVPIASDVVLVGDQIVIVGSTTNSIATWASEAFVIKLNALVPS